MTPSLYKAKQNRVKSKCEELYRLHRDIITLGIKADHNDPTNLKDNFFENKNRIINMYINNMGKVHMIKRIMNEDRNFLINFMILDSEA